MCKKIKKLRPRMIGNKRLESAATIVFIYMTIIVVVKVVAVSSGVVF